jgi:putative transposase
MPTKKKPALRGLPTIPKELLEQFGGGMMTAEAIEDASAAFKKALIERALSAKLGHHLGYPSGAQRPEDETNQRNGKSGKTVLTGDGPIRLSIPRDRDSSFHPF